jgi:hypothetical protein
MSIQISPGATMKEPMRAGSTLNISGTVALVAIASIAYLIASALGR